MIQKKLSQKQRKLLGLTTLFVVLNIPLLLGIFPLTSQDVVSKQTEDNDETLNVNDVGYDLWWNTNFEYRSLINITNPYNEAFDDFVTKISFNYTTYVTMGKMNDSLKDVRIVQNGIVKEYYIQKDFPNEDIATVWFKVNVSAGPIVQQDTYMYYGNNSIGFDAKLMAKNPDGLIWYNCEEGSGNILIDSMGNYNATIHAVGADLWDSSDPAIGAYSLTFTNNDYIAIQDLYFEGRNTIDALTVMVWFKTAASSSSYTDNWAFFDFDRSETFNFFITPGTGGNPTTPCTEGSIGFGTSAQGSSPVTSDFFSNTDHLNDGRWHFAAASYDGLDKRIYINDSLDNTDLNAHAGLALGRDTTRYGFVGDGSEASTFDGNRNGFYYTGSLDEVRFFEQSLDANRIEQIYNGYELATTLNEEQIRFAQISVIAKDVDGRIVPNVEVTLYNETGPFLTQTTDSRGLVEFIEVPFGDYNMTANFTSSLGVEKMVFNSSEIGKEYSFNGLIYKVYIELDIWAIDFQVEDWNGDPMDQGFIEIWDTDSKNTLIDNLTINPDTGLQTFRWLNTSSYYYEIYYNNPDYTPQITKMNSSTILRSNYVNNFKTFTRTININESATEYVAPYFGLNENYYTSDSNSTEIGNTKIIDATFQLDKMLERLHEIYIYTISNKYDPTFYDPNEIFYKNYVTETSDIININVTEATDAFGLRMELSWLNTSANCNGTVNITYTQTCNQFIKLNMSKLEIRVFDYTGIPDPIQYIIVEVRNNSTKDLITSLITDPDGIATGQTLGGYGFWYLNDVYEFSLEFYGTPNRPFNVTYSDQWVKGDFVTSYNYTLSKASLLEFEMNINLDNFLSEFRNQTWDTSTDWGDNMSFEVNYTISSDGGNSWSAISSPDYAIYKVRKVGFSSILLSGDMDDQGNGNYSITLNSGSLTAGLSYTLSVYGSKIGYIDPDPAIMSFQVNSVPTSLTFYNYSNPTQSITSISQYYGESMNVSILYNNSNTDNPLLGATLNFNWDYGSGSIMSDTRTGYEEYYVLQIDTTSSPNTGLFKFKVSAELENYTSQVNVNFDVFILDRPTLINGTSQVLYISENVYALDSQTFIFNYTDTNSDSLIDSANDVNYFWQKLDELGNPIIGETDSGVLTELPSNLYLLSIGTDVMEVGDYFVYVTLQKFNYEDRAAIISLSILERPTRLNGSLSLPTVFKSIDQFESFNFTFTYTDSLTSQSITDLDIQSYNYSSDAESSSGNIPLGYDSNKKIYYLDGFDTSTKPNGTYIIDVFFGKQNYSSQTVRINLVINFVISDYNSSLNLISKSPLDFSNDIYWRDEVTVTFNFTTSDPTNGTILSDPDSLYLQFLYDSLNPIGTQINLLGYKIATGIYSYTFNTSAFNFVGGYSYYISIKGGKSPYTAPHELQILFKVQSILTQLTVHNYTTNNEYSPYVINTYWNQQFNITIRYSEIATGWNIEGATVSFSWFFGSGVIQPDSVKGNGYYTFLFDTGNATETSVYNIQLIATKQNFTDGLPYTTFQINIMDRPTELNSTGNVFYVNEKIYILDVHNFTFRYIDVLSSSPISNADELSYILQKLDSNGYPISGETFTGSLIENSQNYYVLDLDTESLSSGEYSILITLRKDNYEYRTSVMTLTVQKRVFSIQMSIDNEIEIDAAKSLQFQVTLTDPNNSSATVSGAEVYLMIGGTRYDANEIDDGVYQFDIPALADPFFVPEFFRLELHIEKTNFLNEQNTITLNVKMNEIFPGVPTFYFILIVVGVAAVVGSLVAYRAIQQARIPKFVKRTRAMKKEIKGRKSISDSLLYPSKEEYILKEQGDKWDMIGLSLGSILGIDTKRKKTMPKTPENEGGVD